MWHLVPPDHMRKGIGHFFQLRKLSEQVHLPKLMWLESGGPEDHTSLSLPLYC